MSSCHLKGTLSKISFIDRHTIDGARVQWDNLVTQYHAGHREQVRRWVWEKSPWWVVGRLDVSLAVCQPAWGRKGMSGVLACALKGSTDVELSPMFSIGFT
jgi:hypothetical protein